MRLPIRTRLTLVFAGVTLVVLAAAAAALLLGFRAELRRTVDGGLRALTFSIRDDPASRLSAVASDEVFAQYVAPDGTLVTTTGLAEPLLPRQRRNAWTAPGSSTAWSRRRRNASRLGSSRLRSTGESSSSA